MCWAACDRLSKIARQLRLPESQREWRAHADFIRRQVRARAWDEAAQTYTSTLRPARGRARSESEAAAPPSAPPSASASSSSPSGAGAEAGTGVGVGVGGGQVPPLRVHFAEAGDSCTAAPAAEAGVGAGAEAYPDVDASLLLIPELGFEHESTSRFKGTVHAIEGALVVNGFVFRTVDERVRAERAREVRARLAGDPRASPSTEEARLLSRTYGASTMCTCWFVDALEGTGRREEGRELFSVRVGGG